MDDRHQTTLHGQMLSEGGEYNSKQLHGQPHRTQCAAYVNGPLGFPEAPSHDPNYEPCLVRDNINQMIWFECGIFPKLLCSMVGSVFEDSGDCRIWDLTGGT